MPGHVLVVDLFSLLIAVTGFFMAFRQDAVRRLFGRPPKTGKRTNGENDGLEPLTYVLRIAGIMMMAFGVALGGMITMFNLA